jgi:hypothetical protein
MVLSCIATGRGYGQQSLMRKSRARNPARKYCGDAPALACEFRTTSLRHRLCTARSPDVACRQKKEASEKASLSTSCTCMLHRCLLPYCVINANQA